MSEQDLYAEDLKVYSTSERDLLFSLPFRVGIWISHVDDGFGKSDDRERAAVLKVIGKAGRRHVDSSSIDDIARACLACEARFDEWEGKLDNILDDVRAGRAILKKRVSVDEADEFSTFLMEVGTSVAKAFREDVEGWGDDEDEGGFTSIAEKVSGFLGRVVASSQHGEMNISPDEDTALTDLAVALQG